MHSVMTVELPGSEPVAQRMYLFDRNTGAVFYPAHGDDKSLAPHLSAMAHADGVRQHSGRFWYSLNYRAGTEPARQAELEALADRVRLAALTQTHT